MHVRVSTHLGGGRAGGTERPRACSFPSWFGMTHVPPLMPQFPTLTAAER